jgi:hypothetical protein
VGNLDSEGGAMTDALERAREAMEQWYWDRIGYIDGNDGPIEYLDVANVSVIDTTELERLRTIERMVLDGTVCVGPGAHRAARGGGWG